MRASILIAVLLVVPACEPESESCLDNIALDLTNTAAHGYNHVRTMGTSINNATWPCNGGGSAMVTGTITPGNTTSYSLTFNFMMCADTLSTSDLVLTGTMTTNASFNSSSSAIIMSTSTASALTIYGDEIGCNADPIDATCAVDITYTGSSSGTICGLTF